MATVRWDNTGPAKRMLSAAEMIETRINAGARTPKPIKRTEWKNNELRIGEFVCHISTVRAGNVSATHVGWYVNATCLVFAIYATESEAIEAADSVLQLYLQQIGELLCVEAK